MATYNGEKYLREQLDSIFAQTYTNWRLIIRDDCSHDQTVAIIQEYIKRTPEKIRLIQAESPSGSAQNNFFSLLPFAEAPYIMLSDQDDIWLPEKVTDTLQLMQIYEERYGKDLPILIHTDLMVVNKEKQIINESLFKMQHMEPKRKQLNHILVQNIVTGCTMMANRPLLDMIHQIPEHAVMHDMWMALIAAAFGQIGFVPKSTILYRQHGHNVNGAKNVRTIRYFLWKLFCAKEIHENLMKQYRQADEFLEIFKSQFTVDQKKMLEAYRNFDKLSLYKKAKNLYQYKLYKKGLIRIMGQILR